MQTWRPPGLLRIMHGLLALVSLPLAALMVYLGARDDDGTAWQAYAIAAVLLACAFLFVVWTFNRRITLTDREVRIRNTLAERRIPLATVVSAEPKRSGVFLTLSDGSVAKAMAVGNYYWLAPHLSRADKVAEEITSAARRARA
ncbi:hypothetical protein [Streptomyces mesophilus]|uniref:hypothetical protein n=1 Tax=Streptomyces mesophilus TaxID=1775132 RepID=UPI0033307069